MTIGPRIFQQVPRTLFGSGVVGRLGELMPEGDGWHLYVVDAALEGADGRAGLILCGLYGEPPQVLEALVSCAASRPGVVGIDLAGGPAPDHS